MFSKIAIIIPSLNPDEQTIEYIKKISKVGFFKIIVVNDGSEQRCRYLFTKMQSIESCIVLVHPINMGKGRALKTAFEYIISNYEDILGVITVDADGQHLVKDVMKVASCMIENPCALVLGTRNFNEKLVPFKSRFGNKVTTVVFSFLYTKKINDTQTGLRGLSYDLVKQCISFEGERFEYEINMLMEVVQRKILIIEQPIETVYINNNRETHFDAVKDSIKIYRTMFKYFARFSLIGFCSLLLDISIFWVFTTYLSFSLKMIFSTFIGTIIARMFSSLFNYFLNKRIVYKNRDLSKKSIIRYYALCVSQMLFSWLLVNAVYFVFPFGVTSIKLFVDLGLFFLSFHIQRLWVYKEDD